MSSNNKIIWTEGMFLRPQHFQQQDRHLHNWVEERVANTRPYSWGLIEMTINHELLGIGKFGLKSCRGIFPDGTPFRMPEDHPLPEPVDIDTSIKDEIIYLSLPVRRDTEKQISSENTPVSQPRYQAISTQTADTHSGSRSEDLQLDTAAMMTSLRFQNQSLQAFTVIPISQITELRNDNQVVIKPNFIPACLNISASPRIMDDLVELTGLLEQRGKSLAERLSTHKTSGVGEIIDFLFLQTINRNEPLFKQMSSLPELHPLDVYMHMLALTGELSTMTNESHRCEDLPEYRHAALNNCIPALVESLRKRLNWVPEMRAVSLTLEEHKYGVRTATVHDKELLVSSDFILAVNADIPVGEIQQNFPKQTTISTIDNLRDLVVTHTPGISISPLSVAPRQIPFRAGYSYFKLDNAGKNWKQIVKAGSIALHFSGNYPGLQLELWAIKA